ncbi:MAG: hypothetical protein ACOYOT_09920 [Bacteroidales bacterium]
MKQILLILSVILLAGCGSSKRSLQNGNFNEAIELSVKNLRKNPTKEKEIAILAEAYTKAQKMDGDRIQFLKSGGEEASWEEIYNRYSDLQNRQTLVSTLSESVLNAIQFSANDYSKEVFNAKNRTVDFLYKRATASMTSTNKPKIREAFYDLQKVKHLSPDYKQVDALLGETQFRGTNQVLFKIKNASQVIIPRDLEADILKVSLKDLNINWLNYDTQRNPTTNYDYFIQLTIRSISVSPEQVKESNFTEEKEVQDGFKYILDQKGNVKKDSLGNDVKIPIIKVITCKVIESRQLKTSTIGGTLDYIDARSGQLVKTLPVSADMVFENRAATAIGDLNALRPESKKWLGNHPVSFPSNEQMVYDGGMVLKDRVKDLLWNNRNWLKE